MSCFTFVVVVAVNTVMAVVDCKTVGFFLKISKEIGKAWRTSLMREAREPHTPVGCVRREKKNRLSVLHTFSSF